MKPNFLLFSRGNAIALGCVAVFWLLGDVLRDFGIWWLADLLLVAVLIVWFVWTLRSGLRRKRQAEQRGGGDDLT